MKSRRISNIMINSRLSEPLKRARQLLGLNDILTGWEAILDQKIINDGFLDVTWGVIHQRNECDE